MEDEATMTDQSQISATVSAATKDKLDRFTESHGLKKNFVVEQALLYFMEARSYPTKLSFRRDSSSTTSRSTGSSRFSRLPQRRPQRFAS